MIIYSVLSKKKKEKVEEKVQNYSMEEAKRRKLTYEPMESDNGSEDESGVVSETLEGHALNNETRTEGEAENLTDDEKLKALLTAWGVSSFRDNLHSCGINYKNLKFLEETDYTMLLKNDYTKLGDMIIFRNFHRQWKNSKMYVQCQREDQIIDVQFVLKNGGETVEEISNYFEMNHHLTDPLRIKLVDLILSEKRQLSRAMLSNIADQICIVFPGELKRVYYEKLKNKQPTGLLYQRYNQARSKKDIQQPMGTELSAEEELDNSLTDEVRSSIDFLNNVKNYEGDFDTSVIIHHWEASFSYRNLKTYSRTTDAINDWLPLQKTDGYLMIHIDFTRKYGDVSANSLTTKWEDFIFRNHNVILEGIRDAKVKKTLLAAQSENDINIRDRIYMTALHHLAYMVPSKVTLKNKTWTPTIPDSKDAFLKLIRTSGAIGNEMKSRNKFCELKNIKEHPVIFESNSEQEETEYMVGVASTIYECSSLIDAVDAAFKIFVTLNIPFAPQCEKVWHFLNEIFYKIPLQQKPSAKLISVLNSYQL